MEISLFERLCKIDPSSNFALLKQFRMNESIMELSNSLVYEGSLETANEATATQKLLLHEEWDSRIP